MKIILSEDDVYKIVTDYVVELYGVDVEDTISTCDPDRFIIIYVKGEDNEGGT